MTTPTIQMGDLDVELNVEETEQAELSYFAGDDARGSEG
jgi:hypothetical protein